MSTVYFSSATNSTTFTTCCRVAIDNEANCPKCKKEVLPIGERARFQAAKGTSYG